MQDRKCIHSDLPEVHKFISKNLATKEQLMSKRMTTLPDKKTMLAKLKKVADTSLLRDEFYPILMRHAGETRNAEGIFTMFNNSILLFAKNKARLTSAKLYLEMPRFIDAMVDDPKVARETKGILEEMLNLSIRRKQ